MPAIRNNTGQAFRFQGQCALLTYSCIGDFFTADAFAHAVVEHIRPLGNDDYHYRWAVEQHHDEGVEDNDDPLATSWHVHIVIDLGKPCTERGQIFDFGRHHPNILPKGGRIQFANAAKYLKKDGWYGGNLEDEEAPTPLNFTDIWTAALTQSQSQEEFHKTIAMPHVAHFTPRFRDRKSDVTW